MKKIFIGCDHAAFLEKQQLIEKLNDQNYQVVDLGSKDQNSVHYPDFAKLVCQQVLANQGSFGILLCGSGIGMSIAANRFKGIRAALCRSVEDAKMSRAHNNSNVLCLGARANTYLEICQIVETWLATSFEGGRHQTRIDLIDSL